MVHGQLPSSAGDDPDPWCWRLLGPEELPLAWPLAALAGAAPNLASWIERAGRWLARARLEGGGLGALCTARGVLVGLAHLRPRPGAGLAGGGPVLEVPWLVAVEVTAAPRSLPALLDALACCARAAGCDALRVAREGPCATALAGLAAARGWRAEARHWCWSRPDGGGAGSVVPAPRAEPLGVDRDRVGRLARGAQRG